MHDYWTVSYFSLIVFQDHFLLCVSYTCSFGRLAVPACTAFILSILLAYGENKPAVWEGGRNNMLPRRAGGGDTIYIMHAYGQSQAACPCWPDLNSQQKRHGDLDL